MSGILSEKELIKYSLKFKIPIEDVEDVFVRFGIAAIKGAEAGKRLKVVMDKLKEKENVN